MNRFGFIKDAAQKVSKKAFGFSDKHPIAATAGIFGGVALAGEASGYTDAVQKQRAGEWLESQPELLQALKNEVGVMVIMKKGITEEMRSKFPGIDRMDMNPTRGNIQTITKYVDSNPKEMAIVLDAFKKDFRGHLMSSVDNYVNILYNNATNRGM
tara:strand:- start:748 stop:1215 length:468 start_codon:yes stop_codon:yes gene_type:complete